MTTVDPLIIQIPLVTEDSSGVWIIEIVRMKKWRKVMVTDNFPVILTIAIMVTEMKNTPLH